MKNQSVRYLVNGALICCGLFSVSLIFIGMLGPRALPILGGWNPYTGYNNYLILWQVSLYGVIFSYLVFALNLIGIYNSKSSFFKKIKNFYTATYPGHFFIFCITFPFLLLVALAFFSGYLIKNNRLSSFILSPPIFLLLVTIFLYVVIKLLKKKKDFIIEKLVFSIIGLVTLGFVCYLGYAVTMEIGPRMWGGFKLNDSQGVYIINDDGDYWLTYYVKKEVCAQNICQYELEKKGNTAIIEAPVDLEQYVDKPVQVSGTFVRFIAPLGAYPQQKRFREFCVVSSGQKTCRESKGHGVWHFSPLKINSIDLVR